MNGSDIREMVSKNLAHELRCAAVHDIVRPVLALHDGEPIGKRFEKAVAKNLPDYNVKVTIRAGMYHLEVVEKTTNFQVELFLAHRDPFTMECFDRMNTAFTIGAKERNDARQSFLNTNGAEEIAKMLTAYNELRAKVQQWYEKNWKSFPDYCALEIKGLRD
jgi:hypothetical protein